MTLRTLLCVSLALAIVACSKNDDAERREAEADVAAQIPGGPESLPVTDSANLPSQPTADASGTPVAADGAALPVTDAEFDPAAIPESTASLPPFPFFKDPEGLENDLQGKDAAVAFDRHYFIVGKKVIPQEGKMGLFQYNLENPPSGRKWTEIEFLRNYDNAIKALGGREISAAQYDEALFATVNGGRDEIEKFRHATAPADRRAEHHAYLIRQGGKEYWIHVSAGATIPVMGYVTVLEKQGMQSSIAFLDAEAMKKELDAKGKVTLYINFDTNKATLRPDAQPIMDEINKLLTADGALKLSIEGHTDSDGSAEHNRQLSTSRARAVFGALVGLGVDPTRLSSKGFGPDKPIADNGTDDGKAKNRRVELVKVN
jgi:OmpA-OmpF porin, OOP family